MAKRRLLAAVLVTGAVAVTAGWLGLRHYAGQRAARESATVVEAVRKVARLTTVEMNVSSYELRRDAKNLLGFLPIKCEKTVAIFYRGKVAAGFDLDRGTGLSVNVANPGGEKRLVVELPEPEILYTDAPAPDLVVADGSVCNRIEPADYRVLINEARTALEKAAIESGILAKAEDHARSLVTAVAAPLGFTAEVRTRRADVSVISADRN
jgi:Protein of unknown function (DUF4230)